LCLFPPQVLHNLLNYITVFPDLCLHLTASATAYKVLIHVTFVQSKDETIGVLRDLLLQERTSVRSRDETIARLKALLVHQRQQNSQRLKSMAASVLGRHSASFASREDCELATMICEAVKAGLHHPQKADTQQPSQAIPISAKRHRYRGNTPCTLVTDATAVIVIRVPCVTDDC
jgi:hypothetical protein